MCIRVRLNQAIVDAYLRRGLLAPHVADICESYKQQLDGMLGCLAECPGVCTSLDCFPITHLRSSALWAARYPTRSPGAIKMCIRDRIISLIKRTPD